MAKTRKGSRKSATKGRKKTTKKKAAKSARRPARRRAVAPSGKMVDLNPIKKNLRGYMDQLSQVDDPRVKEALAGFETVQKDLSAMCFPSMVIPA